MNVACCLTYAKTSKHCQGSPETRPGCLSLQEEVARQTSHVPEMEEEHSPCSPRLSCITEQPLFKPYLTLLRPLLLYEAARPHPMPHHALFSTQGVSSTVNTSGEEPIAQLDSQFLQSRAMLNSQMLHMINITWCLI